MGERHAPLFHLNTPVLRLYFVEVVNLAKGQGFTQVRPLLIEVKTYFLLRLYCFGLDLDYKIPTPLIQEPATSLWCIRVSLSLVKFIELRSRALLIKVAGSLDLQLAPSHT